MHVVFGLRIRSSDAKHSSPRVFFLNGGEVLQVRSEGGIIDSAVEMGDFLEENGIGTFVLGYCESACLIVPLSSGNLRVSRNARFGFHRGASVARAGSEIGRFISKVATDQLVQKLVQLGYPIGLLRRPRKHHLKNFSIFMAKISNAQT